MSDSASACGRVLAVVLVSQPGTIMWPELDLMVREACPAHGGTPSTFNEPESESGTHPRILVVTTNGLTLPRGDAG